MSFGARERDRRPGSVSWQARLRELVDLSFPLLAGGAAGSFGRHRITHKHGRRTWRPIVVGRECVGRHRSRGRIG